MNEYQEQILDHYKNPRNFGKPNSDDYSTSKSENISCGDEIQVYILKDGDKVQDCKFTGRGCSISIAATSLLSEEFKSKGIEYIQEYSEEKLYQLLGIELTSSRKTCALLSLEAFRKALG